ncbi:MAG: hypothetical protein GC181_14360 [Bacteroidetes bacterium]|nr:hypothetical protein [Bacteroidota bacterium]
MITPAEITVTEILVNILQFTIPALIVFGVTYMMLQKFFEEGLKRRKLELMSKTADELTPVKLQAYERLTLLLERLKPDNLVLRNADARLNASQFKQVLTNAVNDEFNHNVSQQIYVSDQAWSLIKVVKDNTLEIISSCNKDMIEGSSATDLGKAILQEVVARNENSAQVAINFIKREIGIVFGN